MCVCARVSVNNVYVCKQFSRGLFVVVGFRSLGSLIVQSAHSYHSSHLLNGIANDSCKEFTSRNIITLMGLRRYAKLMHSLTGVSLNGKQRTDSN